ncbi:hypothetical protein KY338_01485 [Candidatus Woesearchaeota archaeon]|nr:hypothetical protein [Candidatus Woesearchaeota archaeon]MBW3005586.1 hypothetical protein [Candidatus Woesearchaeota archaeon]
MEEKYVDKCQYAVRVDVTEEAERPPMLRWQTFDWSSTARRLGAVLCTDIPDSDLDSAVRVMAAELEGDKRALEKTHPGVLIELYFDIREGSLFPEELLSRIKEHFPDAKHSEGK